jgi:hypothetical protein
MEKQRLDEQQIIAIFKEAVRTLRRLPPVRVQGYFSVWPEIVYSQAEVMRMDKKTKTWPPTPDAISRMEKAIDWLNLLETVEERKIVWMRANNIPWNIICKTFGICRSAANKKFKKAVAKILTVEDLR